MLAATLAVLVAFHGPILSGFASLFRVDDPAPSDAIVVLIGGLDHRPRRAAELYEAGIAPRILIGTSSLDEESTHNETRNAILEMRRRGVPESAIEVIPGRVTSTRHEAAKVAEVAASRRWTRITVVTTAFHTSRARWTFRKAMKRSGVDVRMAAAENPGYNERTWYKCDEGLLAYMNETFKVAFYRLRY